MNIRKAKKKDYKIVNELMCNLHNYHAKNRPDVFPSVEKFYTKKEYKTAIKKECMYFLAEENNEILGLIGFTIIERNNKECLKVNALYVKEEYRNKKVATKLMKKVLKYSKKRAKTDSNFRDCVELSVFSFNENALSFYKKIGFTERTFCMEYKKEA